ncbi:MAG: methionyl-tRNA formyltransferase [Alphaproteobacteria bacterium]|uniref:Methionyl-tRNA formyltransferase n=1 Tax=Candidatus Nitrobium versatile TaxID=2884831 RepID=A0A953JC79_9BACT|nr:methionyl-tRNA formyltransferase [Candidatus Nitrobium versatile]
MALVFFGTPRFAVPSLQALLDAKEEVALVVTQPDKVKGRGHVLSAPPVKELALARHLPVVQPEKIRNADFYRELAAITPEFIVVVAYGKILPVEILGIPVSGCINVHASLLPAYRGAGPIQRALINGEKITGVTTMRMDKGMDTGDILLQAEVEIMPDDTAETLSERLSVLGAQTLIRTLQGIRAGEVRPVPQSGETSYAPPLKKEDGRIDWNRSATDLFHFIRGMYPWPAAFCSFNGERIKVVKARFLEGVAAPGLIVKASGGELVVGTGKGLLSLLELQPEGKKSMPAAAFIAGRRIREGHEKFS